MHTAYHTTAPRNTSFLFITINTDIWLFYMFCLCSVCVSVCLFVFVHPPFSPSFSPCFSVMFSSRNVDQCTSRLVQSINLQLPPSLLKPSHCCCCHFCCCYCSGHEIVQVTITTVMLSEETKIKSNVFAFHNRTIKKTHQYVSFSYLNIDMFVTVLQPPSKILTLLTH